MSTTTTSPSLDHPVGHLVVRAGAVRAAPDDDEVDGARAPRRGSGRRCRHPTSRSVRPGRRSPGTAECARGRSRRRPRPARRPRRRPCACAGARSRDRRGPARPPGMAARSASTFSAHMWLSTATRRAPGTSEATRAYGSSSSPQCRMSMPRAPTGLACAASTSRRGATSSGIAGGGDDEAGQALERHGVVARRGSAGRAPESRGRRRCRVRSPACWIAASRAAWSPPCMASSFVHRSLCAHSARAA